MTQTSGIRMVIPLPNVFLQDWRGLFCQKLNFTPMVKKKASELVSVEAPLLQCEEVKEQGEETVLFVLGAFIPLCSFQKVFKF